MCASVLLEYSHACVGDTDSIVGPGKILEACQTPLARYKGTKVPYATNALLTTPVPTAPKPATSVCRQQRGGLFQTQHPKLYDPCMPSASPRHI
jgi:hypothetical protein